MIQVRLRLLCLFLFPLLLCTAFACAGNARETRCRSFLMESLNYTPEEAEGFSFSESASGTGWQVRMENESKNVYIFTLDTDGRILALSSPYELSADVPGEGALRGLMRSVPWRDPRELVPSAGTWLGAEADSADWSELTPDETLYMLFTLAFSDVPSWSPAVHAWYTRLAGAPVFEAPIGPDTETLLIGGSETVLSRLTDGLPDALNGLELPGRLIQGAVRRQVSQPGYVTGMLAVHEESGPKLYMLIRQGAGSPFHLLPLPGSLLESCTGFSLFCLRRQEGFGLALHGDGGDYQVFSLLPSLQEGSDCLCEVLSYTSLDLQLSSGLSAVRTDSGSSVRTWNSSGTRAAEGPVLSALSFLDFLNPADLPRTPEALNAAQPVRSGQYIYLTGAHLFREPSVQSRTLGFLFCGTCVSLLETEGDFLHVQAGPVDGWVQSMYAVGPAPCSGPVSSLFRHPLACGVLLENVTLRKSTGLFAAGNTLLDRGTCFRVLSRSGSDLLIAVTDSPDLLIPASDRTIGWISSGSCAVAPSPSQAHALAEFP